MEVNADCFYEHFRNFRAPNPSIEEFNEFWILQGQKKKNVNVLPKERNSIGRRLNVIFK